MVLKKEAEIHYWYVFYTHPRAEKKISEKLSENRIEHYLPLLKTLKQWSDRKKIVIEPLFKSYIFIRISKEKIKQILVIEGIHHVIRFGENIAIVPDEQINYLKLLLEQPDQIEIKNQILKGDAVEIISGPLAGVKGVFVSTEKDKNFAVNIDIVGQSIIIQVPPAHLRKI